MSGSKQIIAQRLQDELVAFLAARLTGAELDGLLETELDHVLEQARSFTLSELVSLEQVQITARKYAVSMDISGAIPELVGDIVERLYDHGIQGERAIAEVISDDAVMALLDKLLEIPLSRQGMAWLGSNPVLLAVLAGGAQLGVKTLIHQGLPGPLREQLSRRLPQRWTGSLEARLQEWLLRRTEQLLSDPYLYQDDNLQQLRDLVGVAWDDFSQRPVAELRELVSSEDIQELFVIIFEYWRTLRESEYFGTLLDTGVEAFFDSYQDTDLRTLLDEVGVSREMMLDDARRFVPPIMAELQRRGLVQQWLHRHLDPFFASDTVSKLLEGAAE